MRPKKNKKLLLIISLMLLIVIIGISIIFFATDILKGNKKLFFKYIDKMSSVEENFLDPQLKMYFEKLKTVPYSDEGTISVNITDSNNENAFNNANNMKLSFSGQVNEANEQAKQDISLKYSNTVEFPIKYKKIENTIGIQTNYIGSKFIATNPSSKQNSSDDSNISTQNIQESVGKVKKIQDIQLTKEDLQHVKETYLKILNNELKDEYFSKIEEPNSKGYKLTLTGANLKNIEVKILEILKNDQRTLDKINEYIKAIRNSAKFVVSDVDNLIADIQENTNDDTNIEITVYESNKQINKIAVAINDYEVSIEKKVSGNDLQYIIGLKTQDGNKIELATKFSGLQSMQSITENHELTVESSDIRYQYNYSNITEFMEMTNIEKFNKDDTIILEELDDDTRTNLLSAISERIQSVNKDQMQELGWNENPLPQLIPNFLFSSTSMSAITGDMGDIGNLEESQISDFNAKFENYESTNLQGVTVKGLLTTISINNGLDDDENEIDTDETEDEANKYLIKEIHFNGEEFEVNRQNITTMKDSVEKEAYYRVEFEKDETTGIIYRVVINKK